MNGNTKKLNTIIALCTAVIGIIVGVMFINSPQNINERAASSASLSISPSTQEVNLDKSFTSQVVLDAGEGKVTGIDINLTYDPAQIIINDIKPTSELNSFNTVIKKDINSTTGEIRYTAFTFDKNLSISGKLNIITIYGNIPNSSTQGVYSIKIKDTSIIIATGEGQNILNNVTDGEIKIIGGVPNSCGGTCGSNSNCQANYFCFEGFCRNPVCQTDTNCDCAYEATTKPTAKATAKTSSVSTTIKPSVASTSKSTVRPMATGVSSTTSKPVIEISTLAPESNKSPEIKNEIWADFSKYLAGISIITIFIIALFFSMRRYSKNKTHIMPPTNI